MPSGVQNNSGDDIEEIIRSRTVIRSTHSDQWGGTHNSAQAQTKLARKMVSKTGTAYMI